MPKRFQNEGYHVTGAGKIFHGNQNKRYLPNYAGSFGGFGPLPKEKLRSFPGSKLWDWGVYPERDEQMPDHKIAAWAVEQLHKKQDTAAVAGRRLLSPARAAVCTAEVVRPVSAGNIAITDGGRKRSRRRIDYGINLTRLKHVAPTHGVGHEKR